MPTQNGQGRCRVLLPCGCKLEGTCLLLARDGWLLVYLGMWLPCHLSIADDIQIIQEMQTFNYYRIL